MACQNIKIHPIQQFYGTYIIMNKQKKEKVDLPIKITMTEEGESYFIHNQKQLAKLRMADGSTEQGLELKSFAPKQIQSMLLDGYISKIEISRVHYEPVREGIMDLSRAIAYVFLYKKFNQELLFEMLQCDCVRQHNRLNPTNLFDEKTKISKRTTREHNTAHKAVVVKLSKEILTPVWVRIKENKNYSEDEVKLYTLMANKFISQINSFNWYIITTLYKQKSFSQIISILNKLLFRYLEKSKISEYIALMVMELALNNENTNIRRVVSQKYSTSKDINPYVFNPEIRKSIVKELEENGQFSHISYKIGGSGNAIGKQGRFQITFFSQNDTFQEIKESVESKRNIDTTKKSLTDFYHTLSREEQEANLGFYYLSYLNEECRNSDIKFESFVNQFASTELTVINMIFNI